MKRQTKADKRASIEHLADEAETAAKTQNIAAGFSNSEDPVKDVNGNVITDIAEQTNI